MRPMLVVMPDVVVKDCFEVTTAENERPVETLFADGPYPPLRDRVRTRCAHWRLYDSGANRSQHFVEGIDELRVAIADQEIDATMLVLETRCEIARLLGDPSPDRMLRHASEEDFAAFEIDKEQHVDTSQHDCVD